MWPDHSLGAGVACDLSGAVEVRGPMAGLRSGRLLHKHKHRSQPTLVGAEGFLNDCINKTDHSPDLVCGPEQNT